MNHVRSRPAPNDAPVRLRQNYLKRVAAGSWTRPFKADHDMSVTPEKSVRARATLGKIGFVLLSVDPRPSHVPISTADRVRASRLYRELMFSDEKSEHGGRRAGLGWPLC